MVFVGSATRSQPAPKAPPRHSVIGPNREVQEMRRQFQTAFTAFVQQLETLVATAVNSEEQQFWTEQLGRILKGRE